MTKSRAKTDNIQLHVVRELETNLKSGFGESHPEEREATVKTFVHVCQPSFIFTELDFISILNYNNELL